MTDRGGEMLPFSAVEAFSEWLARSQ